MQSVPEVKSVSSNNTTNTTISTLIPDIEANNVIKTYDNISTTFDGTRYKAWPMTIEFVNKIPKGSICLEVGCGNGKNMFRNDIDMIGIDTSNELLKIAKNKGKTVSYGDGCSIDFKDDTFDSVFSIAVLHHVSSSARRMLFVSEMLRICKVNGSIMIQVWATTEPKYKKSKLLTNDTNTNNKDKYADHDRLVSFLSKTDNKSYERYYHFFEKEELSELIDNVNNTYKHYNKMLKGNIYFEKDNWVFIGYIAKIDQQSI